MIKILDSFHSGTHIGEEKVRQNQCTHTFHYHHSTGHDHGIVAPFDVDVNFEKQMLAPLNRVITTCGYNEVPASLTYSKSLW